MIFTKALVLKVLGGLAVCTGVTVGGVKLLGGSGNEGKEKNNQDGSQKPEGDRVNSNPTNQNNSQGENPAGTQEVGNTQTQPQTSPQTQQNPPKPRSEEGTDPGSSTGDRVDPQPQQKPSVTEGNPQSSQPQSQNNAAGRSGTGVPIKADQSITNSGLVCTADTTNNKIGVCTGITEGKTINVKWEDGTKREGITSLTIPEGAKIKYEKYFSEDDYENYLKISIEGGDIALTGGTPTTITKLEQFETYEVKEEGSDQDKKYYLKRKTTIFDHKIKLLNIPKTCQLVTNETQESCSITKEQLEKIKFNGRASNPSSEIVGNIATLTILKTDEKEFTPEGYKFILKTNYNITISGGTGTKSYTIAPNTNTEFKIKKEESESTLERAWDIDKLAEKVNLENCGKSDTPGTMVECAFKANARVNVMNDNENIKDSEIISENPKMKYEKDKQGFNQGFKFYSQADIKLSGEKKIGGTGFGGSPYEIKKIENEWYLSKVTTK